MKNNLVLSIFPGIDILGKAFEEEGYCVVRGPDVLWGGDIKSFHPPVGVFVGIIGGPPCPEFSHLKKLLEYKGIKTKHGNLIPEYERVVSEAAPEWFLMENVPLAPTPSVDGYEVFRLKLNNRWLGEIQSRERHFSFGTENGRHLEVQVALFENQNWHYAVTGNPRPVPFKYNGAGKLKKITVLAGHGPVGRHGDYYAKNLTIEQMCLLQGLPETFCDEMPFGAHGKRQVIGNAVPFPMAKAVARAVKVAMNEQ